MSLDGPLVVWLPAELARRLEPIGRVDVLVGVPTFNEAPQIGHLLQAVGEGLKQSYPDLKTAVMVADGGSTDGTREAAEATTLPAGVERIVATYDAPAGTGRAWRMVLRAAAALEARACLLVGSGPEALAGGALGQLGQPVLERHVDLVSPLYAVDPFHDPLNDFLVYPLTRALYGVDLRRPLSGDVGLSPALVRRLVAGTEWIPEADGLAVGLWACTVALAEGYGVTQVWMGAWSGPRDRRRAPLRTVFRQNVATIFRLLDTYSSRWQYVETVVSTPVHGTPVQGAGPAPRPGSAALLDRVADGAHRYLHVWQQVMDPELFRDLTWKAPGRPEGPFLPPTEWARVVYRFALAFQSAELDRSILLDALLPVFLGRLASFARESAGMDYHDLERAVHREAKAFLAEKHRLTEGWRHPEERTLPPPYVSPAYEYRRAFGI